MSDVHEPTLDESSGPTAGPSAIRRYEETPAQVDRVMSIVDERIDQAIDHFQAIV